MVQITSVAVVVAAVASSAVLAVPAPISRSLLLQNNRMIKFGRELDELVTREPAGPKTATVKKAGRGAERALNTAGNVAGVVSAIQGFTGREYDDELEARAPPVKGKKTAAIRSAGRGAGRALDAAGNAAGIVSAIQGFTGREYDDELEARAPPVKGKKTAAVRSAGRGAGRALDAAGNVAGVVSAIQGFTGREYDDELEARAPPVKGKKTAAIRSAGRGAERALNAAGNAAGVISLVQGFTGREFDDMEFDARDFDAFYDELD